MGKNPNIKQRSREKAVATSKLRLIPKIKAKVNRSTVTTSTPEIRLKANWPPISRAVKMPISATSFAAFILESL